jgi:hypothetical protein
LTNRVASAKMLTGACVRPSEGKSDGDDLGQHPSPDPAGFGHDPVYFRSGYGSRRDVLALAQGIERNRPFASVEKHAN